MKKIFTCILILISILVYSESFNIDLFKMGSYEQIEMSIKNYKIDINELNMDSITPLMIVAAYNTPETAALLIKNGINIEKRDKYGRTAIFYAICYNKNINMIKTLILSGSKINVLDYNMCSALDYSQNNKSLINSPYYNELIKNTKKEYNFRNIVWGDPYETVKKSEENNLKEGIIGNAFYDNDKITFNTVKFLDYNSGLIYKFDKSNKIYSGAYILHAYFDTFVEYIAIINKIIPALTKKYGEPAFYFLNGKQIESIQKITTHINQQIIIRYLYNNTIIDFSINSLNNNSSIIIYFEKIK